MSSETTRSVGRFGDSWKRLLSCDELSRAVFVDFEARAGGPQVILGVLTSGSDFTQYVVDPGFESAATAKLKGSCSGCWCSYATLHEAVQKAVRAARQSGGPIIGFSIHEMEVVEAVVPEALADWVELYRDGKRTAKRWARTRHPEYEFTKFRGRGSHTLDQFLKLVGYQVPRIQGAGNTGKRLAHVRDQIERRGTYSALTPTAKAKWTNVLMHNYHDVHGLRELLRTATAGLE